MDTDKVTTCEGLQHLSVNAQDDDGTSIKNKLVVGLEVMESALPDEISRKVL